MNRFRLAMLSVSLCCSLSLLLSCELLSTNSQASSKPTIVVNVKKKLGPVNRKVFGQVVRGADRKDIFSKVHDYYIMNQSEGMWNPKERKPSSNAITFLEGVNPTILRYPGGLNTQGHDWKKTVGPVSERPNFQFGLDEYMQVCEAVGAQAQIVVTEYIGTSQDLAEMVEYLNAPADAKHPWAQKRAKWGHVKPYGVKYFELGNESWAKKLRGRGVLRHSGITYAKYAKAAITAMKKVDPTIQIGVVLINYPEPATAPWNTQVLAGVGDLMDFGIVHTYCVGYHGNKIDVDEERLLTAVLPASEQLEIWLNNLQEKVHQQTGRNIPFAVTEFNGMFAQHKPKKYRYSYASALFSADYLRVLLKPKNNILLANYWQFFNSYFGMVQGKTDDTLLAMPAYPMFRLWADHFGDQLLKVDVRHGPHVSHRGFGDTAPSQGGRYQPAALVKGGDLLLQGLGDINLKKAHFQIEKQGPRSLTITLDGLSKRHYPNLMTVALPKLLQPTQRSLVYQISFDLRFVGEGDQFAKGALGLGLSDGRGWTKTIHSAVAATVGQLGDSWQHVNASLKPLTDITSVMLVARLECGDEPTTGRLEIRHLKWQVMASESYAAYAALTASASCSDDGQTTYLIVFNKHPQKDIESVVAIKGMKIKSARFWQISNPPLNAMNTVESQAVKLFVDGEVMPLDSGKSLKHLFPARSMTAIELK